MYQRYKKPEPLRINFYESMPIKLRNQEPKLSMKEIFGKKSPKKGKIKNKKKKVKNTFKYH